MWEPENWPFWALAWLLLVFVVLWVALNVLAFEVWYQIRF